jgi:CubicO group peptidase (beta-lactamase class C family)
LEFGKETAVLTVRRIFSKNMLGVFFGSFLFSDPPFFSATKISACLVGIFLAQASAFFHPFHDHNFESDALNAMFQHIAEHAPPRTRPASQAGLLQDVPFQRNPADPQFRTDVLAFANAMVSCLGLDAATVSLVVGDTEITEGFGYVNGEGSAPVTDETLFGIGSTTKAFTSTLVALADKLGKVSWTKPVSQYDERIHFLDEFADRFVNLEDMMAHLTGLARHDFAHMVTQPTPDELAKILAKLPGVKEFRHRLVYNNGAFFFGFLLIDCFYFFFSLLCFFITCAPACFFDFHFPHNLFFMLNKIIMFISLVSCHCKTF